MIKWQEEFKNRKLTEILREEEIRENLKRFFKKEERK